MSGTNPGQDASDPAVSGAAWVQPQPQAVLGLSSSAVYGTAFTSSIPQSFQLATGGLFKLIVDPVGYLAAFPQPGSLDMLLNVLGSGVNGNVQVTVGTVSNVSIGLSYNIHLGDQIEVNAKDKVAARVILFIAGGLLTAAAIAFQIAYDQTSRDDKRMTLVLAFQGIIEAIVAMLVAAEVVFYEVDRDSGRLYKSIFGTPGNPQPSQVQAVISAMIGSLIAEATLAGLEAAPVIDSQQESLLNQLLKGTKSTDPPAGSGAYISVGDQGAPS